MDAERYGAHARAWLAESVDVVSAPGARLGGGTSEVQRNIIGERLLGLPREPK